MEQLKRIMLVEDENDIREIAIISLSEIGGFTVISCSSGQEALDRFGDNLLPSEVPQLILLDVMMPEVDGPATLNKLKEIPHAKAIPIIFMTARIQAHEIEEYNKLGALGVISKPFDPRTLPSEVMKIWTDNVSKSPNSKARYHMENLFADYAKTLPERMDQIIQNWGELKNKVWRAQEWENFYRGIHSLISSTSMYGYLEVHKVLVEAEKDIKPCVKRAPTIEEIERISTILPAARKAISIPPQIPDHFADFESRNHSNP